MNERSSLFFFFEIKFSIILLKIYYGYTICWPIRAETSKITRHIQRMDVGKAARGNLSGKIQPLNKWGNVLLTIRKESAKHLIRLQTEPIIWDRMGFPEQFFSTSKRRKKEIFIGNQNDLGSKDVELKFRISLNIWEKLCKEI